MRTNLRLLATTLILFTASSVEAQTKKALQNVRAKRVMKLGKGSRVVSAFSPDGRWVAQVGKRPGVVRIYDLRRRALARQIVFSEKRSVARYKLRFSPRSRYLVVVAYDGSELREHTGGDRLLAWRVRDGELVLSQKFPPAREADESIDEIRVQVITKGERRVGVVLLYRGDLMSYELVANKRRAFVFVGGSIDQWPTFAVSPDGGLMAAMTRDNTDVRLYSPWTGKLVKRLPLPRCRKRGGSCGHHKRGLKSNGAMAIVLTKRAVFVSNGNGAIWRRRDWKRLAVIDDRRDVSGEKAKPSYRVIGDQVYLRSRRGGLVRWDLRSGQRRRISQSPTKGEALDVRRSAPIKASSWRLSFVSDRVIAHRPGDVRQFRLVDHQRRDIDSSVPRLVVEAKRALVWGITPGGVVQRWQL